MPAHAQRNFDNEGLICAPQESCVRCGGSGAIRHEGLRDRVFGAPGIWAYRQCTSADCGIAWLDPQPLPAEIGKLYADYHTHDVAHGEAAMDETGLAMAEWQYAPRRTGWKRWLVQALPSSLRNRFSPGLCYLADMPAGKVLDVGCGSGGFLAMAAQHGWDAHGIDFDPKAVAAANRRAGVTAHVGALSGVDPALGPFDAIVFDNVIEHLPDAEAVFAQSLALLRPGGRLVMITPNLDAEGHRIFGPDWRGLEVPRHLQVFTARALCSSAEQAGFTGVKAFSYSSGIAPEHFIAASREIAERSGRAPKDASAFSMKARTWLGALSGKERGEMLTLIACR